jgi:hypothetical protein
MKNFLTEKRLRKKVEEMADNDFSEYFENEPDKRKQFIEQVVDYGINSCKTYQEVYSFIDGFLMEKL